MRLETKLNNQKIIIENEVFSQARGLIELSKKNQREEIAFLAGEKNEEKNETLIKKMYYQPKIKNSTMHSLISDPKADRELIYQISKDGFQTLGCSHTHSIIKNVLLEYVTLNDVIAFDSLIPEKILMTLIWDNSFVLYQPTRKIIGKAYEIRRKFNKDEEFNKYETYRDKANNELRKCLQNLDIRFFKFTG